MRYDGLLSQRQAGETYYATCNVCDVIYQDDARELRSIKCPKCENAVVRGLTREEVRGLAYDSCKELFS